MDRGLVFAMGRNHGCGHRECHWTKSDLNKYKSPSRDNDNHDAIPGILCDTNDRGESTGISRYSDGALRGRARGHPRTQRASGCSGARGRFLSWLESKTGRTGVEIHRADSVLRAVFVPAGGHEIEFDYNI